MGAWAQQYHPRHPRHPRQPRAPRAARRAASTSDEQPDEQPDDTPDDVHDAERAGHWRTQAELTPSHQVQNTPYDLDARYGKKRATSWVGYKLHVTETCTGRCAASHC